MTAPEVKALDAEPTLPDPADMGPYSEGELQVVRAFYYGSPDACWMCSGEPFDPDETELPVCGACAGEVNGRLLSTLDATRVQLAAVQEGFAQANVRAAKAESAMLDRTAAEARDWSKMTPREAWEHAKAMPRIAGPWNGQDRCDIQGRAAVYLTVSNEYAVPAPGDGQASSKRYPTRAAADAALRAAGWLLVDDEGG